MDSLTPEAAKEVRELRQDAARAFIFLDSVVAAQSRVSRSLGGLITPDLSFEGMSRALFRRISHLDDMFMAFDVNEQRLLVGGEKYQGGRFLISAGPSASGKDDVMGKPRYNPAGDIVFDSGTALDRISGLTVDGRPLVSSEEVGRPVKATNRDRRPRYLRDAHSRELSVPVLVDGRLELRRFEVLGSEVTGRCEDSADILVNALNRVEDSGEYHHAERYLRDFLGRRDVPAEERKRILDLSGKTNVEDAIAELNSRHRELREMLYRGMEGGAKSFVMKQIKDRGSGEINGVDYWFFRREGSVDDFRTLEGERVFDVAYTYSEARYGFAQNSRKGLYATYQMTYPSLGDAVLDILERKTRDPVLAEVVSRYADPRNPNDENAAVKRFILEGTEMPSTRKQNPRARDGTVTMLGLKEFAENQKYRLIILGSGTTPEAEIMLRRYPESELSYIIQGGKDRPIEEILDDMKMFQGTRGTEDPAKQEDRRVECGPHIKRGVRLETDGAFNESGHRVHILENDFDETKDKRTLDRTQRLAAIMLAARIVGYDQKALRQIIAQLTPGRIPITAEDIERIGIPVE